MRYRPHQRGYTLLEMIVSVGIFSLVMLAATSAYLSLIDLDRRARSVNDVVNNFSFAIDSMAREIRTGTNYQCDVTGTNCTSGGDSFQFTDANGRIIRYQVANGQLIATIDDEDAAITDPRITITALTFYVRGVGTGDGIQPQVIFTVIGEIPEGEGQATEFSIETSATQRVLEL